MLRRLLRRLPRRLLRRRLPRRLPRFLDPPFNAREEHDFSALIVHFELSGPEAPAPA